MTIKVGDRVPAATVYEFIEDETPGCSVGPNAFKVQEIVRGKRIAVFGLPGAYTPTCSAKHLPGYIENAERFKGARVDEIWCVSVNDAFVMGAWGREQGAKGKVRMMADGSAIYTQKLGVALDLTEKGLGIRCRRFSMLVEDGVVRRLNLEEGGKLEVSSAQVMLKELS